MYNTRTARIQCKQNQCASAHIFTLIYYYELEQVDLKIHIECSKRLTKKCIWNRYLIFHCYKDILLLKFYTKKRALVYKLFILLCKQIYASRLYLISHKHPFVRSEYYRPKSWIPTLSIFYCIFYAYTGAYMRASMILISGSAGVSDGWTKKHADVHQYMRVQSTHTNMCGNYEPKKLGYISATAGTHAYTAMLCIWTRVHSSDDDDERKQIFSRIELMCIFYNKINLILFF